SEVFKSGTYSRSLGPPSEPGVIRAPFLSGEKRVVEAESFHITNVSHVDNAPVEVETPSRRRTSRTQYIGPERRLTAAPLRLRFGLQRRGQVNFRRHVLR